MIKLSILILTTPKRRNNCFQDLLYELECQTRHCQDVEIIGIYDNKKRSVGEKRNAALSMAKGEYLTFIDDDDRIDAGYVSEIMSCLENNPGVDCVVFDCITSIIENGAVKEKHFSKYSKDYSYSISDTIGADGYRQWRGKPAHTMVWRSEIAKRHAFPDKNYSEDVNWVSKACADLKTEAQIDKVLYFYNFNQSTSETRS